MFLFNKLCKMFGACVLKEEADRKARFRTEQEVLNREKKGAQTQLWMGTFSRKHVRFNFAPFKEVDVY
jgi:hypothetical protein